MPNRPWKEVAAEHNVRANRAEATVIYLEKEVATLRNQNEALVGIIERAMASGNRAGDQADD
jgi:hypothetical protein